MKLLLLIVLLVACPVLATGQARTAERIVSVSHSQLVLDTSAPNGSVRHVINGLEGTTPCLAGGTGALAMKINGVWECPKLTPGLGTGDMLGPSASAVGEMAIYNATDGKHLGRSTALNGVAFLTNGVVTGLASSGTGDIVRSAGATITGVNATGIFSSGTVPAARVISGSLTNQRCLRLSNTGQIEVASNDCGTGAGGAPGGVSGNIGYNEAGAFGGLSNTAYDSVTGRLLFTQKADGNDSLNIARFTDTSPTGTLLRARNAANNADLFVVNANGSVLASSTITITNTAVPATPAAGNTITWTDSTDKNLKAKDDAGNVSFTVRAITCTGTDKLSAISSAGVPACSADQTSGGGSGITTLNTLTAATQTFANVDDTNVTLVIGSATSTHTFTMGWTGTLAKARQNAATVYNDAGNTFSTGAQSFAAATSLTVPTAAGAAPTASAQIAYDSTGNTLETGVNGTNRTFVFTAGAQTLSSKTLDNTTTANLKDTLLTLQDDGDATKTANFDLSGITTGTNRVVTIPNAASTTIQPTTATANQWVTNVDSAGVQQKAQPSFANLSGSLAVTQGSTGQSAVSQGDLLYGDATNSWARLAKSATATRYLSNTGASNNPAWAQVDLTNGVTGVLPPANWSPLTTKGDIAVHNGTTTTRLAVGGTNGFALKVNSATATGLEWSAVTATAGGSSTQVQYSNGGSLAGVSGAVSDGTSITFTDGTLILNGGDYGVSDGSMPASPVEKAFYLNTNVSSRRLFIYNNAAFREIFQSGLSGPVSVPNGGTGLASGTSGGVPYFSSSTTIASSGALTANLPVIGGGAGAAPSVGTRSGNTTAFVTTTGSLTSGRCTEWDASGNLIQASVTCGNALTANPLSQFAATTSAQLAGVLSDENGSSGGFLRADGTIVVTSAKTASFSNSITFAGTDATTMTFPSTSATIARTDAANTFTGTQTFGAVVGTTWNGNTWATGTGTLSIAASKTLTASNTLTFTGTDSSSVAFGAGGTVTYTVASGTSALGTSAISSGACATVVTTAATGTATTDVIGWGFNGDPTGVTGYAASVNGMLTIIAYPSANNVNFLVCNNTSASVTPGAITLNWRVTR